MVKQTHDVELGDEVVVKVYRRWALGEPDREWQALQVLDRRARGLAPRPLDRGLREGRPYIAMSRVAGEPLGSRALSPHQVAAAASALRELHQAVPEADLAGLPERRWGPAAMVSRLREWIEHPDGEVPEPVRPTFADARTWVRSDRADAIAPAGAKPVFTNADGNIANLLWDGERCRIVDFEDAGVSDLAYELADLSEHLSVWLSGGVRAETLVSLLGPGTNDARTDGAATDPGDDFTDRLVACRTLFAIFWLLMLLPGGPAASRNPEGTLERQASRLADLLGRVGR